MRPCVVIRLLPKCRGLILVALGALTAVTPSAGAASPEIWMFAGPYVSHPFAGWESVRRDMGDMWQPDAPWQTVANAVSVIQFPPTSIDRATDGDLSQAISDIKRRNIAFAVGTGLLIRSDRCRSKSEAYVDEASLEHMFDKLRRDGADVKYVTMDEPFYYGHKDSGPTACHETAQTLAQALIQGIAIVRKYFPNAQIGTDEVVTKDRAWVDELVNWTDVYQQVTGEKLAYLHADLSWAPETVQNLVPLAKAFSQRHLALGIDYDAAARGDQPWFDANSIPNSDVGWVQNAVDHFTEVESGLGIHPDHAVLTTWVHYPSSMLPETQPGTFTNLVYRYVRQNETPSREQSTVTRNTSIPEIWFFLRGYATDPQKSHGVDGQEGWQKLFMDPDARWPSFMDHVQVVAFNGNIKTVPDDVLAKAFTKLNEKHVAFAIESLSLSWVGFSDRHCGNGVEGYTDPPGNLAIARRIKAAGGNLAYVTMDGPLFGGRYYSGPNACHDSIQTVATRAAAIMRQYRQIFPNVIIGDTEPFPALTKQPNWQNEYREWMQAFNEAYGKPIAFLNMDIDWPEDNWRWQPSLQQAAQFARSNHLQLGIIYNAAFPEGAKSDQQWLDRAAGNFTEIEGPLGITPDKALFESWTWYPKRSITDDNGLGEDYLVKQYLIFHGVKPSEESNTPQPNSSTVIFEQPDLAGVPGNFFVPSSAVEKNKYPKSPPFKLIFWQGNPFQADGELVPSNWNAELKTGLDIGEDRNAQYSLKSSGPSSTVQIKGHSVGAYLNSADLINSRFQADPAMMITPGIDLPDQSLFPFADPQQELYQSMKLRIPTAVSQSRPHNTVYVVSDFLFVDRTTGTKITYEVGLFHQNPHAPALTPEGLIKTEVGLFDPGTHSYQVGNPLSPLARLNEPVEGSALYSTLPWPEERHIAFTISWKNFKTGLESLNAKGGYTGSMNPADYALRQWHLNAEMQYDSTPTQIGWSLSDTTIALVKNGEKE